MTSYFLYFSAYRKFGQLQNGEETVFGVAILHILTYYCMLQHKMIVTYRLLHKMDLQKQAWMDKTYTV